VRERECVWGGLDVGVGPGGGCVSVYVCVGGWVKKQAGHPLTKTLNPKP